MMTDRQFDKLENAIAAWQAAGLDVAAALRAGGQSDTAEQFFQGLQRTGDEMARLRQELRPVAR